MMNLVRPINGTLLKQGDDGPLAFEYRAHRIYGIR